jgi:hypothetical protein
MVDPAARRALYRRMVDVSGPHIRIRRNTRWGGDRAQIYGSYHFNEFHFTRAQRDTLLRFEEFEAPADFTNRTVVDIGSNLGSLSFECLRRGARQVLGLEYCEERIACCRQLAALLNLSDRCAFRQIDLREHLSDPARRRQLLNDCGRPDIVFCCAIDAYLDRDLLYEFVAELTTEVCYFETNSKISPREFRRHMRQAGFETVTMLGRSRSDSGFGRRIYLLDKKVLLSQRREQRRSRVYRWSERLLKPVASRQVWKRVDTYFRRPGSWYDHRSWRLGDRYIREFASRDLWEKVKRLYDRIAHIPYVQECDFSVPQRLTSPLYSHCLAETQLTLDQKERIRRQVADLIVQMNRAGVAHRDLHCGNVFLDQGQIRLIDLEFLEEDSRPLDECYDVTGEGLECPMRSGRMHAFKDFGRSLKNMIGLTREDLGLERIGLAADATVRARAA